MTTTIPKFLLYGETQRGQDPPFIHVESIPARSRASDWKIAPHRHDVLSHFLLVLSRSVHFRIDADTRAFTAPVFISVPSKLVHGFEFAPETDGIVLTMSEDLVARAAAMLPEPELKSALGAAMIIPLAGAEREGRIIADALTEIARELEQPRIGQLSALMAAITRIVVTTVRLGQTAAPPESGLSDEVDIVNRLRRLLGDRHADCATVAGLARALGISVSRLNTACRRVTGCSTLQLTHAALMLEAKRHLIYTSMSMSQIAFALGFGDPAYFSRFFTKREGLSPLTFRKFHTKF